MKALTVRDLALLCSKAIQNGHGDKKILLSNDDEGNGFHELFGGFTTNSSDLNIVFSVCNDLPFGVSFDVAVKDYVILG